MKALISLDEKLFYAINGLRSDFLDYILSFFSSNYSFILMILFSVLFLCIKEFKRHWWVLVILIGFCFLFADRISVICFKDVFHRLRPSHALQDVFLVRLKGFSLDYTHKGGLYGFISSHAANAFAIVTMLSFIGKKYKWLTIFLFSWAIIVGYSRIYCGVHYPLDVICGAIVGVVIGYILYKIYKLVSRRFMTSFKK